MKNYLTFFCLLLFANSLLIAQSDYNDSDDSNIDRYPIFLGLHPTVSIPIGNFGDNTNRVGLGGGFEFLINLNQTPFYMGIASTFSNLGHEAYDFVDPNGFELVWKTNSSLLDGHFLIQYEPPFKANFQPYLMAKIGVNHFFTISRLIDEVTGDENDILERYVDDNSTGLSYGGAIGTLIPLDKNWRAMLNIRASYLKGANASYYSKLADFTVAGDSLDAFDLMESDIDMIRLEVGVLVYLRGGLFE